MLGSELTWIYELELVSTEQFKPIKQDEIILGLIINKKQRLETYIRFRTFQLLRDRMEKNSQRLWCSGSIQNKFKIRNELSILTDE